MNGIVMERHTFYSLYRDELEDVLAVFELEGQHA
jgi:hypothetical protein